MPHAPHRLTTRTILLTIPTGVIFSVDPTHEAEVIARLHRLIPGWAWSHIEAGGYFIGSPRYAETIRVLLLVSTGTMLRMWAESYPAALARLLPVLDRA